MVTSHDYFVLIVNEAIEKTIWENPGQKGEISVVTPVRKGFRPVRRDKEAIKLKDVKIEQVKGVKLFDEDRNCYFDVDEQNFDILRITGEAVIH